MNTQYLAPNWPLSTFENESFFSLKKMLRNWLLSHLKKVNRSIKLSLDDNYGFDTLFIET